MPIFQIKKKKLTPVKEKRFDLEKDLQKLTEDNLQEVFGLEFISSEFKIHNLFIDTLAFDLETKSFVIIEYKKDSSFSVVDQGLSYLSLMLNNKSDFILEYNEKKGEALKRGGVDWSQSKVIFIASSFTPYQLGAIGFKDLPIELWEVEPFENNLILYNQLKPAETQESLETVAKGKAVASVSREVKTYTLDDHLKRGTKKTKEMFWELRKRILEISEDITEKPVKFYIGYKHPYAGTSFAINFAVVKIRRGKLAVEVRINKPKDPRKILKKFPESWAYGTTTMWGFDVSASSEISYAVDLIRQAYEATL